MDYRVALSFLFFDIIVLNTSRNDGQTLSAKKNFCVVIIVPSHILCD